MGVSIWWTPPAASPEEAPGTAGGNHTTNTASLFPRGGGGRDGCETHEAVERGRQRVLERGELGVEGPCGGIKRELAALHCDTD